MCGFFAPAAGVVVVAAVFRFDVAMSMSIVERERESKEHANQPPFIHQHHFHV